MKKKQAGSLKLYVEDTAATIPPKVEEWPGMNALCQAFTTATGWTLQFEVEGNEGSVPTNGGGSSGRLIAVAAVEARGAVAARGDDAPTFPSRLPAQHVQSLVDGLNGLVNELQRTRVALWQREAELATGIPVTARNDEHEQLALRLDGVLKSGAEAVGCQAAALYMLDESTSELKLRSCWGLGKSRLLEPARELRTAIADLEALLGNAVVLEDTKTLPHWKAPENFPSAVCLPVSSPTSPLGTMWVFSNKCRDFTAEQTGMLEVVAGRIAAELERDVLMRETKNAQRPNRDAQRMLRWQQSRLPQIEPLLDGWDVAGWTPQSERVGGEFFDWNVLPNGELALAVGAADGSPVEASLTAAALHSSLRSHSVTADTPQRLLSRMNDTFWMSSSGDQTGSLACALLSPESGDLYFSGTGRVGALIYASRKSKLILPATPALGADPDCVFSLNRRNMTRGSLAVLFSLPPAKANALQSQSFSHVIADIVHQRRKETPEKIAEAIRAALQKRRHDDDVDFTLLVVKRTG